MSRGRILNNLLGRMKQSWGILAQAAAWILSIIGGFFRSPPPADPGGPDQAANFAQFVATVVVGVLAIPVLLWRDRRHIWIWVVATVLSLVGSVAAFTTYSARLDSWVVTFKGTRVLVGSKLTEAAERQTAGESRTPQELLETIPGGPRAIWTSESIEERAAALRLGYILGIPLFTICIISVIQAIACVTKGNRRRA